jgi:hypothetical protein
MFDEIVFFTFPISFARSRDFRRSFVFPVEHRSSDGKIQFQSPCIDPRHAEYVELRYTLNIAWCSGIMHQVFSTFREGFMMLIVPVPLLSCARFSSLR